MTNSHKALLLPTRKLRNLAHPFVMGLPRLIRESPICFLFILSVLPSADKTVILWKLQVLQFKCPGIPTNPPDLSKSQIHEGSEGPFCAHRIAA
jgi:hypothetical protein